MPSRQLQRPDPSEYHSRFDAEIRSVPDTADFAGMLGDQIGDTARLVAAFGEEHASLRYAPEKWTVREVIGHLSDCERILSYRALRIARGDATALPGFDENAYVPAADFERRSLASVMDEFRAVRSATVALVEGLTPEATALEGNVGSGTITVRALLYLIAGHERHHAALFRERYLPALGSGDGRLGATDAHGQSARARMTLPEPVDR
jgi:hypothetical protein